MTVEAWIAVGSLALNLGIAVVCGTWGIAKIKDAVRDAMDEHKDKIDSELDVLGRSFGETAAALRQKIHEVEMWMRDTFVRRDSFYTVLAEMKTSVSDLGKRIETRLERMEEKIDKPN